MFEVKFGLYFDGGDEELFCYDVIIMCGSDGECVVVS